MHRLLLGIASLIPYYARLTLAGKTGSCLTLGSLFMKKDQAHRIGERAKRVTCNGVRAHLDKKPSGNSNRHRVAERVKRVTGNGVPRGTHTAYGGAERIGPTPGCPAAKRFRSTHLLFSLGIPFGS